MMQSCGLKASASRLTGQRNPVPVRLHTLNVGSRVQLRAPRNTVVAFKPGDLDMAPSESASKRQGGPAALQSRTSLLQAIQTASDKGNVYGKPLTKSEQSALNVALNHLSSASGVPGQGKDAIAEYLMGILKEAATTKSQNLQLVEGAMVILEQMYLMEAREQSPDGPFKCNMSREEMLCRWQLVIGADVGAIQYIPVVEEFEVAADGSHFALDTDLDFLFTGFSGESSWLSPGHVQYHVQRVRIEVRQPRAWSKIPPEVNTCRPNMSSPAANLPLPFPVNELFIFRSNGDLGVLRSKLGGLILLVNKTPADQRASLVNTKTGSEVTTKM